MPLRRADRLFDIIQLLRTASGPVTASALAATLEVTPRTVYRDIATKVWEQVSATQRDKSRAAPNIVFE